MPKAVVTDGYTLDEYIPLYLRDMFYKSSYPEYIYNTTNGYGPYDFSTKGLVLYAPLWALKDSPFKSVDAYQHTCTVVGALWRPNGRWFDKIDDVISIPAHSSIDTIFDSGATIMVWLNTGSDGEGDAGIVLDKVTIVGWYLQVREQDDSKVKIRFVHFFDGNDGHWTTTATEVTVNTWTLVAVTYDNGATTNNPTIYINTTAKTVGDGLTETTTPTGTREDDDDHILRIGNNAATTRTFDGTVGDVWLYDRVLTAAEISHIYNATSWRY